MRRCRFALFALLLCASAAMLHAQPPPAGDAAPGPVPFSIDPSDVGTTLVFFNREIVSLRARVLGRRPDERAAGAVRVLQELVEGGITGPVDTRPFGGGVLISVGSRGVIGLAPPDVDELSGETLDAVAARTASRLDLVLDDAVAAHQPAAFLRALAAAIAALIVGALLLWATVRLHRRVVDRLLAASEKTVARSGLVDIHLLKHSRLLEFERYFATSAFLVFALIVIYAVVTFVLRRFPYTRPVGESMRGLLLESVGDLSLSVLHALPNLFTIVVIVLAARFLVRMIRLWFDAVEHGRLRSPWIPPDIAQPTRRLLTTFLWLFTIVMVYPYLPGSQTEAFKGVSVFLGLVVTLGSSGFVQQIMGSFMITYSRTLRVGDFVRIGEVEGTVTHLGILSIKLRTPRGEEVTMPNAVVIAQTTTDYSHSEVGGVLTTTTLTIGYDTPWRQVEALLLLAAERTPGLLREPKPLVVQVALEDFYVRYALLVSLERQDRRLVILNGLHANIQDLFNEYGVQIMSPNYMLDPASPKVVPRQNWAAAPARVEAVAAKAKAPI